jgi:hypothetical protein
VSGGAVSSVRPSSSSSFLGHAPGWCFLRLALLSTYSRFDGTSTFIMYMHHALQADTADARFATSVGKTTQMSHANRHTMPPEQTIHLFFCTFNTVYLNFTIINVIILSHRIISGRTLARVFSRLIPLSSFFPPSAAASIGPLHVLHLAMGKMMH